jgi:Surp module
MCPAPGTDFEKRIIANERDNVKFNFLKSTDPYHAYYQYKVGSFQKAFFLFSYSEPPFCQACLPALTGPFLLHLSALALAAPPTAYRFTGQLWCSSTVWALAAAQVKEFSGDSTDAAAPSQQQQAAQAALLQAATPAKPTTVLPPTRPLEPPEEEQYTVGHHSGPLVGLHARQPVGPMTVVDSAFTCACL